MALILAIPLPFSLYHICICSAYSSVLKMEATGSSKMLVMIYQTAQCHIPEGSYLQRHCVLPVKDELNFQMLHRKILDFKEEQFN
jgi:hypothetical protein